MDKRQKGKKEKKKKKKETTPILRNVVWFLQNSDAQSLRAAS